MSGRRKTGSVFIGVSSLLVIFIVLCLTTFAALSLTSANADLKMARRAAQTVSEYYAADSRAVELLVQADAAVGGESRAAAGRGGLLRAPGPALVASYTVPISDAQELRVEVRYPGPGGRATKSCGGRPPPPGSGRATRPSSCGTAPSEPLHRR